MRQPDLHDQPSRGSSEECSRAGFREWIYLSRPADSYGGLGWLQRQPFVAPGRVAEIGWSNGGGAVLFSLTGEDPAWHADAIQRVQGFLAQHIAVH